MIFFWFFFSLLVCCERLFGRVLYRKQRKKPLQFVNCLYFFIAHTKKCPVDCCDLSWPCEPLIEVNVMFVHVEMSIYMYIFVRLYVSLDSMSLKIHTT